MTAADREAALDAAIDAALDRLAERMARHGGSLAELGQAIARAGRGGKRLRPRLVLRAFHAAGGTSSPALLPTATAFELLHTAFVIHDDLIDDDTVRRGMLNVAGEFCARAMADGADAAEAAAVGRAAAVLAGDVLLHETHMVLARAPLADHLAERLRDLIDQAVLVSAAGELADVEQDLRTQAPSLEEALATSHDKTAVYSFSAPLRAGALLAGADADVDAALNRCGARLGLAFQLVDDLLGAFGSIDQAGRESGADLTAGKHTPLVARAREIREWPAIGGALALAPTGAVALREAQEALTDSGVRRDVEQLAHRLLAECRADAHGVNDDLAALIHEVAAMIEERMP